MPEIQNKINPALSPDAVDTVLKKDLANIIKKAQAGKTLTDQERKLLNSQKDTKTGKFKPGNEIWQVRTNHGRDALFNNPEKLKEAAVNYFEWCKSNPRFVKGIPVTRPYLLEGFMVYLETSHQWWYQFKKRCIKKQESDFLAVIEWIEETMYNQKVEGAACGEYQPMIIARLVGLREQQQHEHSGPAGGPIETDTVFRIEFVQPQKKETNETD